MSSLKLYKGRESELNQSIYNNVLLLVQIQEPPEDLLKNLKPDMFDKMKKSTIYDLIYYLLTILNPELTKKHITSQPHFLAMKDENKFRSDLLKYLQALNTQYEHADLPIPMASQLISPSGIKFSKFLLRLSQLVLYEVLQSLGQSNVSFRIRPGKGKIAKDKMTAKIAQIEHENSKILKQHEVFVETSKKLALELVNKLNEINLKIKSATKNYNELEKQFKAKHSSYPSEDDFAWRWKNVQENCFTLTKIGDLCISIETTLSVLMDDTNVIKHDGSLDMPKELLHLVPKDKPLDLIQFFQAFQILVELRMIDLPNPSSQALKNDLQKIEKLNVELKDLNEDLKLREKQIFQLIDSTKLIISNIH